MWKPVHCDQCPILARCPLATLAGDKRLLSNAWQKAWELRKGQVIYADGAPADGIFALCSGSVKLVTTSAEPRIAAILTAGELFGLDALAPDSRRHFTAMTRENSLICYLNWSGLPNEVREDTQFLRHLVETLSEALNDARRCTVLFSGRRVRRRLFDAVAYCKARSITPKRVELAALLGIANETVTREIRRLEQSGMLLSPKSSPTRLLLTPIHNPKVTRGSSSCPVPALNFSFRVDNGLTYTLPCNGQPAFTATPSSIGVHSPPSTITFSGDPLASSAYGLPRIDFYDVNGSGIGSVTAASMAGDGSSVTAATPGFLLTQYTTGTYFAIINNMNADGTASPAAAAGLYLYANDGVTVAGVSIIGPTYLNAGDNVQYQAIATLTNGSIREVTSEAVWDSSDPQSAYITNPGLVSAPYGWGGMPTLSASYEGVTGTLEVSVGSV